MFYTVEVMNLEVNILSVTSVELTWQKIELLENTMYTRTHRGYNIYYRQKRHQDESSANVSSSKSSLIIKHLTTHEYYLFQVAALIQVDEQLFIGRRTSAVEVQLEVFKTCKLFLFSTVPQA